MTLEDCEQRCLTNCSCTAYSNIDIRMGGTGCLLWFDNLTDIRNYVNGLDLYVKVAASDLQGIVLLNSERLDPESDAKNEKEGGDLDFPLFDFITIADATNNFSENNKLGEGGFGPVYKGVLKEGQEIAVKRLSKDSRQGLDEFKNEVSCIAKLQHRNLVKLLGCCIKEKELLLIYEYMPNKSLDSIIFDKEQSKLMNWSKRYDIINGIARGLLYLHQDSRLRIIHRDLKASNILLDYEMNPRISDFGMARTFGGNEIEANTTRVVRTFGYMSPEYAFEGIFSFKSDVYSFGVLLLEIVSGMKMRGFYNSDPNLNLLSHAWKLYKEGKFMELISRAFVESCNQSEVFRAIQVGLLCVQPYPEDRPSMLSVVLMLSSEIEVPQPKEPSFFNDKIPQESDIGKFILQSTIVSSMEGSRGIILFCCTLFSILIATSTTADDTISANQTIRDDDNGSIESAGGMFELGFFSPGSSKNRYLGIWYKKISNKTVVWVANRETPLSDNSGVLRINANGSLVLIDATHAIMWSSNSSQSMMNPVVAQLFDTGNFVTRHENDSDLENYLWQSFDYPVDTILPGMKLGWDMVTGLDRYTTSWKSANDPSPSIYSCKVNRNGYPQLLVWEGTVVKFRFGPWDGIQFSGLSLSILDTTFDTKAVFNQREIYFGFEVTGGSNAMRFVLSPNGEVLFLRWADRTQSWERYLNTQNDECDHYALCGAYGSCNITQSRSRYGVCGCLGGYQPKYPKKWELGDWADGCVRKTEFDCGSGDTFVKYSGLKLPDTSHSWTDPNMKLEECESMCLKNCSCTAYSHMDIREDGIGCMMWFDDLIDIRNYRTSGLDLYVKINASELEAKSSSERRRKPRFIIIAVLLVLIVLLVLFMIRIFRKRMLRRKGIVKLNPESDPAKATEREDLDLPVFDFILIANATDNFSQNNKLGEGGFGPVYKGILDEGQEIAVKRLSKDSRQGLDEFKNEVSYIAKLRHRNLVRLLGCCIGEGEMLLIYEYMPNKSLDSFIFDKYLSKLLDWSKRYNIINGIARGLLYLHQDSIVRIIHRDLKASNILLDYEMNPKISDFGMARSFGGSGRITNTTKVVGTFGYMSPEYALDGIFSVKSDVYSFGVLLLEIVSGKKMTGFYDPDPSHNLLGHAWRLYTTGEFLELITGSIVESCNQLEVFRAIQIGLLCVQPYPEDRPSMSFVVLMLSSEIELPQPKQPGFFTERIQVESNSHNMSHFSSSSETNTLVSPR